MRMGSLNGILTTIMIALLTLALPAGAAVIVVDDDAPGDRGPNDPGVVIRSQWGHRGICP